MWLPSHLYVTFAAEGLRLCEVSPWRRIRNEAALIPVATADGAAQWQPWVQALADWLAQRPQRRFILHVVLSDYFVRYLVLPWRSGIAGANEWQAYGRHRFREVFGELVAGWQIRVAPAAPGDTALACAIDGSLLAGLKALSGPSLRLAAVQSRFVSGFNHWHHRLQGASCWFVTLEPGRACVALLEKKHWHTMRNESLAGTPLSALETLLHRLELSLDAQTEAIPVYLCGDLETSLLPEGIGKHPLHLLRMPEKWSPKRRQLAMARGM